jgi:uncharacterized protein YndB with AHSA1/START domain
MSAKHDEAPTPSLPHEIVSGRVLPASREAAFAAFSDPARLARWWGPRGFTNVFHEFDFRAGGAWRFTMQGPDGAAWAMSKRFAEIVRPERIVVRHLQQGHDFTLTMTFTAQGDRTALTWRMLFDDPAEAERLRPFLLNANAENFDRLEAHLAASLSGESGANR